MNKINTRIIIGIIVMLVSMIGLVLYLIVLQKPIRKAVPAAGEVSISCPAPAYPSETIHGWRIIHTFSGPNAQSECDKCDSDCIKMWAGTLSQCPGQPGYQGVEGNSCDGSGGSCPTGKGCGLTASTPICSVMQFDCVNQAYPIPGSILAGSANGKNCGGCNVVASSPIPSPTSPPPLLQPPGHLRHQPRDHWQHQYQDLQQRQHPCPLQHQPPCL